jgi:hypothetical protein
MRPTNTVDKEHAPRMYVTTDGNQASNKAALGIIQIDLCDMKLRIHDGCHFGGGAYIPLISNCADDNGVVPTPAPLTLLAPVDIPANGAAVPANAVITHGLGFYPNAQLIDAVTGQVLDSAGGYVITHTDVNTVTVTRPAGAPATKLILRA